MPTARNIFEVVFHSLCLMTCLTGNLFILTVHLLNWLKSRKLSSSDLIINCIAISNIGLQGMIAFKQICVAIFPEFYIQIWVLKSLVAILTSLSFSSLWCATCLCFYYCIKIVRFNGSVFYKVKSNISIMVPWLLVFFNIISWITGLSAYGDMFVDSPLPSINVSLNGSIALNVMSSCNCLFQVYTLLASIAISIIFVTSGTIIISLCKHMKQITNKKEGFGNSRLTSLRSAARMVTSLLILYLALFGSMSAVFNEVTEEEEILLSCIFFSVGSCCPTINAMVLINGNRKLLNAMKNFLGIKSITTNVVSTTTT